MSYSIPPDLLDLIHGCESILCVSHVNPDGDAYGSLLGMAWLLRALGKAPVAAMHDELLDEFDFLPGASEIIGPREVDDDYDLILCLDASSADRMGAVFQAERHARIPLAVIDHHITNTRFGRINWVEPACAATCQMITYLADALSVPLTGALAECLLTGIITDTLGFRTSNTTPEVLEAAMRLQRGGADLAAIVQRTLNRLPYRTLRLWSLVLPDAQLEEGVLWVTVSQAQLAAVQQKPDDLKLNSILATVAEADMSAVFTEKIGDNGMPTVECSFRAKPGFDVGQLALIFGGGGHAPASGCTLDGALADVVAVVVPALKQARRSQMEKRE